MVDGEYAWWGHCLIGSLERLLDGSMLKQRMWAVFYPSLLFYSVSTSFFVEVFWSGTVIKRSLHVEFLSISFDSIEIPTKLYGSPQTLFRMVLPEFFFF